MKIKEFQNLLNGKNIDFALFYSLYEKKDPNLIYFSSYNGIGALVIPKNRGAFLIVPKMELRKIKRIKAYVWPKKSRLFEVIHKKLKGRKIGINKNFFSLNDYKGLKMVFKKKTFVDISKYCLKLRETKTNEEVKIIKKACKITDSILKKCFKEFKKFKTEAEVAAFLEYEARKLGCDIAFKPIVASGSASSVAHYEPQNVKLKKGFCVIDFGLRYKNYCTDVTRTVYIGKVSEKEKEVYNLLLNIQKEAIKEIRLNRKVSNLYEKVKKDLKNYKKYFSHGLGHGFGIEIHEFPNLMLNSKDRIKKNMVFTIEPGIYMKNFGIRIEDDILANNKVEILTKTPKSLLVMK